MRSDERESIEIMRQCPRFERCSVPICPLDLLQDERTRLPGEPVCKQSKNRRYEIGKNTRLPRKGLTKREWNAKINYEKLSGEEKRKLAERGKKALLELDKKE